MNQIRTLDDAATEPGFAPLSELENSRAVDLIESAERTDPLCVCGRHMTAVAHDGSVWLECVSRQGTTPGSNSLRARLGAILGHSRRRILDLPRTD